jgi:hypothetical protein
MLKNASTLLLLSFPLCFVGAIASSYNWSTSNPVPFQDFGLWDGLLVGSVTSLFLMAFLLGVHWKIVAVPKDLFTGSLVPLVSLTGDASIFRQGLVATLAMGGAGVGFIFSALLFKTDTLGIGVAQLMPGIAGSFLIVALWKSLYK